MDERLEIGAETYPLVRHAQGGQAPDNNALLVEAATVDGHAVRVARKHVFGYSAAGSQAVTLRHRGARAVRDEVSGSCWEGNCPNINLEAAVKTCDWSRAGAVTQPITNSVTRLRDIFSAPTGRTPKSCASTSRRRRKSPVFWTF